MKQWTKDDEISFVKHAAKYKVADHEDNIPQMQLALNMMEQIVSKYSAKNTKAK